MRAECLVKPRCHCYSNITVAILTLIVPSAEAVMIRQASDESAMARSGSTHTMLPSAHRNTCNLSPV